MIKKILSEILFYFHLIVVIVFFALFLVPKSLWAGKVIFHFWYVISITGVQIAWAMIIRKRRAPICPITTIMQCLRGHPIHTKENYKHSFIAEFLQRFNIKISGEIMNIVLLITIILVTVQFIWFR